MLSERRRNRLLSGRRGCQNGRDKDKVGVLEGAPGSSPFSNKSVSQRDLVCRALVLLQNPNSVLVKGGTRPVSL